jgi:hypothetical protein
MHSRHGAPLVMLLEAGVHRANGARSVEVAEDVRQLRRLRMVPGERDTPERLLTRFARVSGTERRSVRCVGHWCLLSGWQCRGTLRPSEMGGYVLFPCGIYSEQ